MNYTTIQQIHEEMRRLGTIIAKAHEHNRSGTIDQVVFDALQAALDSMEGYYVD